MSQFQIYRDGRGEYRWRLITKGGTIIATGSEGYISRGGAGIAIQAVKEVTSSAPIVDKTGEQPATGHRIVTSVVAEGPEWKRVRIACEETGCLTGQIEGAPPRWIDDLVALLVQHHGEASR